MHIIESATALPVRRACAFPADGDSNAGHDGITRTRAASDL